MLVSRYLKYLRDPACALRRKKVINIGARFGVLFVPWRGRWALPGAFRWGSDGRAGTKCLPNGLLIVPGWDAAAGPDSRNGQNAGHHFSFLAESYRPGGGTPKMGAKKTAMAQK